MSQKHSWFVRTLRTFKTPRTLRTKKQKIRTLNALKLYLHNSYPTPEFVYKYQYIISVEHAKSNLAAIIVTCPALITDVPR